MTSMRIEGGAELVATLNTLTARVQKNVLRQALENAAEPIRRRMSQMAPRAPGLPDLADNIAISPSRLKGADNAQAAAVAIGPGKDFFYGFYQEYGTVHNAAHPFMRPAFDSGASRAIADITRELWTVLAARGIARSSTSSTPVQSPGSLL